MFARFHRHLSVSIAVLAVSLLAACSTFSRPEVDIGTKLTAKPVAPERAASSSANGAIYQAAAGNYRPLFEDRRARYIGDTLTVQINEKTSAATTQDSTANRTSSLAATTPGLSGLGSLAIKGVSASASSATAFEGKGNASTDNLFTGTITVTVIEVLSNENLIVAGEKQIGIGQNMETLRFSGVVNPATIQGGNTVSSTQIADARIQTSPKGYIDQAQTMGWLSRFFMTYWPF